MKNLFLKGAIKRAYLIAFSIVFLLFFSSKNSYSQTTLSVGDLAFTGINSDGNDSFSFILLVDIAANTEIKFTDKGWNGSAFNSGEGEITYTNNTGSTITAKTQITIRGASGSAAAVFSGGSTSAGSVTVTSSVTPSSAGDQIFAFQGTVGSPTIIAGVHINVEQSGYYTGSSSTLNSTTGNWDGSDNTSDETRLSGTGLTNGTNCVWLRNTAGNSSSNPWEIDNWRVKASELDAVINGTVASIRSVCNDVTKWDFDNSSDYNPCAPVVVLSTATTWNGSTWSNSAPNSSTDAIIASSTTPGAFTCADLTINSSFALTLGSGVTATIHGDLTNSGNGTSGAGTLNFASGGAQSLSGSSFTHSGPVEITTGTTLTTGGLLILANHASLMHGTNTPNGGGSISGNVTFEKTIGSTTDGWRSFSIPVDDLIDNFETGLNTNCSNFSPAFRQNVYYWNGTVRGGSSNSVAEGWTVANNTTDDENKGYAIYLSNNSSSFFDFSSTVSITGTPNDGTKTFNLDYTYDPEGDSSTAAQQGWNLIPNYFPSSLRAFDLINDADFDPTYKAVHIWDQNAGQLKAINQSGLTNYNTAGGSIFSTTRQIPPFMAFWVKANANSQSVQLKNYMRTSSTDSLPANNFLKTNYDIFRIEVKDQQNNMDQYSVAFVEGTTENFDPAMDIYKFKSFTEEVPTLYSNHQQGDMLSLNAVPPVKESYSADIHFESYKPGREYTISPITVDYSNHYNVELIDNKTKTTTDLLKDDYSFNYDENYKNARFTLKFTRKSTTSIAELLNNERSYAYTNESGINVVYKNNNTDANAKVEVYNALGQLVYSQNHVAAGETVNYTPANATTKMYVVRVISAAKTNTIKVLY